MKKKKTGWIQRWRAGIDKGAFRKWMENAPVRELAEYCIEHYKHPNEIGVRDPEKFTHLVMCYDSMAGSSHHARSHVSHEKHVPYQSTSIDHIKDRTHGHNRKVRRGS